MRIAVMIIGFFMVIAVGLQSCAVYVAGNLGENTQLSGGGAIGLLVSLLFILGSAFAIGLPKASMFFFGAAAIFSLMAGFGSEFEDMRFWAFVAAALAVMSYFGAKEKANKAATVQ